jgi:D-arabinose 1-dehydrogenase-like Zn-dependent alcohol dehydrogenase
VGKNVDEWKIGQRVGVTCRFGRVPGISYDGGYSDYVIGPTETLASIPDELSAVEAEPLIRAGVTTYNALRNSGARDGDLVVHLESEDSDI